MHVALHIWFQLFHLRSKQLKHMCISYKNKIGHIYIYYNSNFNANINQCQHFFISKMQLLQVKKKKIILRKNSKKSIPPTTIPPSEAAEVRTPCRSGVRTGSTDSGKLKTERKEAGPASRLTTVEPKRLGSRHTAFQKHLTKWPRKTMFFHCKITSNPFSLSQILLILQECVHENQQNIIIHPKQVRWVVLCSWAKTQCHPRAGHRLEFHVSHKIVWRTISNYTKEKYVWRYIKYFTLYGFAVYGIKYKAYSLAVE